MIQKNRLYVVILAYVMLCVFSGVEGLTIQPVEAKQRIQQAISATHLHRAKLYIEAGDYRRAVEACQEYLDEYPSVEGYVYLAYVYEAIDGYLAALQKKDDWVKVGQVALNLTSRELIDIIDPPNTMSRMAREMMQDRSQLAHDLLVEAIDGARTVHRDQVHLAALTWFEPHRSPGGVGCVHAPENPAAASAEAPETVTNAPAPRRKTARLRRAGGRDHDTVQALRRSRIDRRRMQAERRAR